MIQSELPMGNDYGPKPIELPKIGLVPTHQARKDLEELVNHVMREKPPKIREVYGESKKATIISLLFSLTLGFLTGYALTNAIEDRSTFYTGLTFFNTIITGTYVDSLRYLEEKAKAKKLSKYLPKKLKELGY